MRSILYRIAQAVVLVAVASSFAHADNFMYFKKKAAPAGGLSCTTANDDNPAAPFSQTTGTSNMSFGSTAWFASDFVLTATTRITAITWSSRDLTPVDNDTVTLSIYTDSSGPSTEVTGTAVTIAETSISDSTQTSYELSLSTPITVSAGTYWLVVRSNASTTTSTRFYYGTGITGRNLWASTDGGSNWEDLLNNDVQMIMIIHGCQ